MLQTLAPPPDLSPWIEAAVIVRRRATSHTTCFPALRSGMLVMRFTGDAIANDGTALPAASLITPTTRPTCHHHTGDLHAMGVVLRPEAISGLIRAPLDDLADRHLDVSDVFEPAFVAALRSLHADDDEAAQLHRLFQMLRHHLADRRLNPQHDQRRRLARLLAVDLDTACQRLAICPRQLQRLSRSAFGLTPKQFHSIGRVQQTLRAALRTPSPPSVGTDLALSAGYFDQSHMARDLRRYAGTSVSKIRRAHGDLTTTPYWPLSVGLVSR